MLDEAAWEAYWDVAVAKMKNWQAPGPDGIQAYWIKAFPKVRASVRSLMWQIVDDPEHITGRSVMIPKDKGSTRADRQRPITCLNTLYKVLTGTLCRLVQEHNLLPMEHKALRQKARRCLDALSVDQAIVEEARKDKRTLSMAWIVTREDHPPTGSAGQHGPLCS